MQVLDNGLDFAVGVAAGVALLIQQPEGHGLQSGHVIHLLPGELKKQIRQLPVGALVLVGEESVFLGVMDFILAKIHELAGGAHHASLSRLTVRLETVAAALSSVQA